MLRLKKYVLAMGIPILIALFSVFGFFEQAFAEGEDVASKPYTGTMQLITKGVAGEEADGRSHMSAMSDDARCTVFYTEATNLSSDVVTDTWKIFVAENNALSLVKSGEVDYIAQGITNDCRYVLYTVSHNPLSSQPQTDAYIYDRTSGSDILVSKGLDEHPAGVSGGLYLAKDTGDVAFTSSGNFVEGVPGGYPIAYLFKLADESISVVSGDDEVLKRNASASDISRDASLATFSHEGKLFLKTFRNGTLTKLSEGLPDQRQLGNRTYSVVYNSSEISADNRKIIFVGTAGGDALFYSYTVESGLVEQLPIRTYLDFRTFSLSADGSVLAWIEALSGSQFVPNPPSNLHVKDLNSNADPFTVLPLVNTSDNDITSVALSATGRKIVFTGQSYGWIGFNKNRKDSDVFLWDTETEYMIHGRIADESGAGLERAFIDYGNDVQVMTDASGFYTITNLVAGSYVLTPTYRDVTLYPESQVVSVPPSVSDANFTTGKKIDSVVIFIPGIAGSTLRRVSDDKVVWPIYADGPKMELSLKADFDQDPESKSVDLYAGDAIRYGLNLPFKPIYGPFLEMLSSEQGLVEYRRSKDACDTTNQADASLFVFPYDWRYGVATQNVNRLHEYVVNCIQEIHGKEVKITVVAHSMGGMLATQYLLSYPNNHGISSVISVGTPYLGAPNAVASLLTGKFKESIISPRTTKTLLEYFPGAHQLLPSKQYFELSTVSPLVLYSGNLQMGPAPEGSYVPVEYDKFQVALQSRYRSPAESETYRTSVDFVANNEALFDNQSFANWTGGTPGNVNYYVLYAEQTDPRTISQVRTKIVSVTDVTNNKQVIRVLPNEYVYEYDRGDETVPVLSTSRIAGEVNLNGGVTPYRFKQEPGESNFTHQDLLKNNRIQSCIISIMSGSAGECARDELVTASSQSEDPVRYINLWGVTSLHITNGITTTSELITTTVSLEVMFPDVTVNFLGENAVSIILPEASGYKVDAQSDDYLEAEVTEGDGQLTRYVDVPVENGMSFSISAAPSRAVEMFVDTDTDNTPDTLLQPTITLSSNEATDATPPAVLITVDTQLQTATITATDDLSGVSRIFYSLNGAEYFLYTQPIILNAETNKIYAQAEDSVGNVSAVMNKEVVGNQIFLPLVQR